MADSAFGHAAVIAPFRSKTMDKSSNFSPNLGVSVCEETRLMVDPSEIHSQELIVMNNEAQMAPVMRCGPDLAQQTCDSNNKIVHEEVEEQCEDQHEDSDRLPSPGFAVCEDKKRRRADRYDSSESSDSGVASLTCSDASSWSSSSDITEPVSPASPASSHSSPLGQTPLEANSITASQETDADKSCGGCIQLNGGSSFGETDDVVKYVKKRRRRYSDSTSDTVPSRSMQKKRARRLSGSCQAQNPIMQGCERDWSCFALSSKWFNCFWRNREQMCLSNKTKHVELGCIPDGFVAARKPCLLTKRTGQLKITEFFSTQVKNQWSYPKLSGILRENKGNIKTEHETPPRFGNVHEDFCHPSHVSIVSVAHVDQTVESNFTETPQQDLQDVKSTDKSDHCSFEREDGNQRASSPARQIRFPVDIASCSNKSETSISTCNVVQCLWKNCEATLSSGQSLLDHIQSVHVASQGSSNVIPDSSTSERYVCHWEGCKVEGRISSSRAWLERHVLTHGGHKPFRCIVESCEQRFSSQAALERHVNAHFNQETGQNSSNGGMKRDNMPPKVVRRNSKKLKYRRKAAPARLFDYFDAGIMERLRHQLLSSEESHRAFGFSQSTNTVTLHSKVLARRLDPSGETRVLLQWSPKDLLPDQWVLENEVVAEKTVPLHSLSSEARVKMYQLLNKSPTKRTPRKRRK